MPVLAGSVFSIRQVQKHIIVFSSKIDPMTPLSRRDFLKLSGTVIGSLAIMPWQSFKYSYEDTPIARVATTSVSVYEQPSDTSAIVGKWFRDDIVHIYDEIIAETPSYNPVWYRVWGGYIHRARMQKVHVRINQKVEEIPETGLLGEVTVPFSQAYTNNKYYGWRKTYRLYYESVHWIKALEVGPDGTPWYRILDELDETIYFAPASHLRLLPPEEIAPITPDVPFEKKRIFVDLTNQVVIAYEFDSPVFNVSMSSGLAGLSSDSSTSTPVGDFHVNVKLPSKHMGEADLAASIDDYVLPGVPWATFFTDRGHAFHGSYWHDNYGVPMSHGCINMRPQDAKWLFRWVRPAAGYDEIDPLTLDRKGYGTLVQVR